MTAHGRAADADDGRVAVVPRAKARRPVHSGVMRIRRLRVGTMIVLGVLLYVAITFAQVWVAAHRDEAQPAEAIVVLGAAQYNGRPSPVLEGRLRHVVDLYDRGVAPLVVVTGGAGGDDRFTEASASASYLHRHGVPGPAVERETTGETSYESLASTARFLRERSISRVVLVSDPFHAFRIGEIGDEVGLDATVSPTPYSAVSGESQWPFLLRETAGVSVGRLIGYRRLDNLLDGSGR
ncbi:MAG TPA: YdcF family protein [Euzebyales bacterium]